jgi:hypothetical protein
MGKKEEMRLFEGLMNSEESSYQKAVLREEEDHRHILIIEGISIFMPSIPVEFSAHPEGVVEERQPTKIVTEEQEKTLKSSQEM